MEATALEELVHRCQQTLPGDTRAFESLVAHYKGRVYGIAYRLMGNQQEAEDQAQEAFLKVYRNIKTLEDPATFPAWITRIVTNTCLDALTRRKRRPQTTPLAPANAEEPEELRYVDTRTPTPEEAVLRREVRRCLETALQRMEPGARAVLVLRDIEDRPYQEVADMLAIGLSAVKMRIHRARVSFQDLLERVCPGVARPRSTA